MRGFSPKQLRVLRWWQRGTAESAHTAIICDGAVRSGKTLCMGLSFFLWAMCHFEDKKFGICGKTIISVRRNMIVDILPLLEGLGCQISEKISQNTVTVTLGRRRNTFYLFGGKDEGAAALVQGITLAGALLDEVALMPRSFVEQCCARCSVRGSRIWFSCNPESPAHWFYREWVVKAEEKNALRLTFTMADNPALSDEIRQQYERMFQGAFYRRFILGEWVAAEGRVYDFFDESYVKKPPEGLSNWHISCDYGTVNPTSMGLWGVRDGVWYRVAEYYYNSREARRQKTDEEYAEAMRQLADGREISAVIVDPSAASFIEVLRRQGWRVRRAKNEVISGIRRTAQLLKNGRLVICEGCDDAVREFQLYRWAEDEGGDRVCKEHDHAMDEIRYFAATAVEGNGGTFYAGCVERTQF